MGSWRCILKRFGGSDICGIEVGGERDEREQ